MGILNVTPDSFSDGGLFDGVDRAVEQGLKLVEDGADLLDIGGESTRPGSEEVSVSEELARVLPVIEGLAGKVTVPLSIDTRKPEVARQALAAGCAILNDVGGLRVDGMAEAAAQAGAIVVCMHMLGEPATMQQAPRYDDLLGDIAAFLEAAARRAIRAGVAADHVWIDPGIGFGKTFDDNLRLIRELSAFVRLGWPIVVGASRKGFTGVLAAASRNSPPAPPRERLIPSVVLAVEAARRGAAVLRVHDVAETRQALTTWASVEAAHVVLSESGGGN